MGLKPKNSQQFSIPQIKLWAIKNINPELEKAIKSRLALNASRVTTKAPKLVENTMIETRMRLKPKNSLQSSIPQLKLWAIKKY